MCVFGRRYSETLFKEKRISLQSLNLNSVTRISGRFTRRCGRAFSSLNVYKQPTKGKTQLSGFQ